ncbi:MAG TPA: DNA replication and repair protein RecF [Actinobacteria bacterium]|nr:DNA replication and repair protein RecF [Actinomycetota bacterium]
MRLRWLELTDVRVHRRVVFEPAEGLNVLVGGNGAGKTTLLEGIGYLARARSFRGTPEEDLIRRGAAGAILRGEFEVGGGRRRVEVELPRGSRRRILVDGKRPRRLRDLVGTFPVVVFHPDDLDLVKAGPGLRREYLDDLAAGLWPEAAVVQDDAETALRQRNAFLRAAGPAAEAAILDVWDAQYAAAGARVYEYRRRVIAAVGAPLEATYRLVGGAGEVRWRYEPTWLGEDTEPEEAILDALRRRRGRDLELRRTSAGPHRDDPVLELDGRPLRSAASQGEQRTAALACRLAALVVLGNHRGEEPVLLVDDVLSELDPGRVDGVLRALPQGQVFLTTTDEGLPRGTRWKVAPDLVEVAG